MDTHTVNSCLDDVDDEVRDRAAFNLKLMQDEPLANTFVRDGTPPKSSFLGQAAAGADACL